MFAGLGLLVVLLWCVLTVHYNYGGNWTGLFCTGEKLTVPPPLAGGTYRFHGTYGYDGEFYRYVAHDPFFQKGYARFIDSPRFRYGRALIPLVAWTVALGRAEWIDFTYVAVVLVSIALGVYWSSRYMVLRGRHPAWGLVFLILPASLTSMDRMLTDATLTAFFAGFLFYAAVRSWGGVYTVSMLAVLARETGILLIVAVVLYWLMERRWTRAALHATAVIPFLCWSAFVASQTPLPVVPGALAFPLSAFLASILQGQVDPNPTVRIVLSLLNVLAVFGLLASVLIAFRVAWSRRTDGPVPVCVLLFGALTLMFGTAVMSAPYAYGRAASPILLFVMTEAIAAGAWLVVAPPAFVIAGVGIMLGSQAYRIVVAMIGG